MPLELLQEIAQRPLPLTVTSLDQIDKLRVLRAADHIAVLLPDPHAENQFARVLAITPQGRQALRSHDIAIEPS